MKEVTAVPPVALHVDGILFKRRISAVMNDS
jgi:hypothetical protein